MGPIRTLTRSVTLPFKALYVVGLCFVINLLASPGHWWVQWVALGFGIALIASWARMLRLLAVAGLAAIAGRWAWNRWGQQTGETDKTWMQPPPAG